MTLYSSLPDFFSEKNFFSENFWKKKSFFKNSTGKKMLNIKRIFFLTCCSVCLFGSEYAFALGQKPVRDASYYIQELGLPEQTEDDFVLPVPETKILAKCGESGSGNEAVGILITDKGEAYGYSGQTPINSFKPSVLLVKNKEDIDKILKYADSIKLESVSFKKYPESATVCGLDYLKDFSVHSTAWAKHPYLRESDPPPQELITLFEAINNVVKKQPPFPDKKQAEKQNNEKSPTGNKTSDNKTDIEKSPE